MRVSKRPINSFLLKQIYKLVYQAIADLKTPQEVENFLNAFLSESEHKTLVKRIAVAYFLDKGKSYSHIKESLKVSSATISSTQDNMQNQGVQQTLKKIRMEEWAAGWSKKIKSFSWFPFKMVKKLDK